MNTDNLRRLGEHVISRRTALGYKRRVAFAQTIGISDRVLGDIEHGYREAGAGTYAMMENGLGWRPGSAAAVLRGEEPVEFEATQITRSSLSDVPIDDLLGEIRRRITESASENVEGHIGAGRPMRRMGHRSERRVTGTP